MKKHFLILSLILIVACLTTFISCKEENEIQVVTIDLSLIFRHHINGDPVIFDAMNYYNKAGNRYEVTEVQWFISDVRLEAEDGSVFELPVDDNIHYIDTNIPLSDIWNIPNIPVKNYNKIKFTFGLKGERNTVGLFTEAPEVNMIWPYHMGGENGGYHYMKLNGFWVDQEQVRQPFNFHLGVGKTMEGEKAVFHQNWFEVELPFTQVSITQDANLQIPIVMNIENWFENPYTWDHNEIGGKIMDNQEAMHRGAMNGAADVFELETIYMLE